MREPVVKLSPRQLMMTHEDTGRVTDIFIDWRGRRYYSRIAGWTPNTPANQDSHRQQFLKRQGA
jgi:hypothetical protein